MSDNIERGQDKKAEGRPTLTLSYHRVGPSYSPRYMISNQFLQYWTGSAWTAQGKSKEARVYPSVQEATKEMHELLLQHYGDLPVKHFKAPVFVSLFCKEQVTTEQLRTWLHKVSRLLLDTPIHGNGPLDGSLAEVRIEWDLLKENE